MRVYPFYCFRVFQPALLLPFVMDAKSQARASIISCVRTQLNKPEKESDIVEESSRATGTFAKPTKITIRHTYDAQPKPHGMAVPRHCGGKSRAGAYDCTDNPGSFNRDDFQQEAQMPFLTPALMGGKIGTKLVTNFETANPDVLESELIPVADGIIARLTGLEVPDDPADQDPQLTMYASWIVLHLMSPHMAALDQQRVEYRKALYDDAIESLTQYKAETRPAGQEAGLQYTSNPGVKALP
jgi:hypothetical protein